MQQCLSKYIVLVALIKLRLKPNLLAFGVYSLLLHSTTRDDIINYWMIYVYVGVVFYKIFLKSTFFSTN